MLRQDFRNKRILFLGSSNNILNFLSCAKQNGAYTIVTDTLSYEVSETKKIADEYLSISTDNYDAIAAFSLVYKIDAISLDTITSDIIKAKEVSERLNIFLYFLNEDNKLSTQLMQ